MLIIEKNTECGELLKLFANAVVRACSFPVGGDLPIESINLIERLEPEREAPAGVLWLKRGVAYRGCYTVTMVVMADDGMTYPIAQAKIKATAREVGLFMGVLHPLVTCCHIH